MSDEFPTQTSSNDFHLSALKYSATLTSTKRLNHPAWHCRKKLSRSSINQTDLLQTIYEIFNVFWTSQERNRLKSLLLIFVSVEKKWVYFYQSSTVVYQSESSPRQSIIRNSLNSRLRNERVTDLLEFIAFLIQMSFDQIEEFGAKR